MTCVSGTRGGGDTYASGYEELRRHVLAGSAFGSRPGLVVLLRQGLAAWMACRPAGAGLEPVVAPRPCTTGPVVSDEVHAGLVRVLAGMVTRGPSGVNR